MSVVLEFILFEKGFDYSKATGLHLHYSWPGVSLAGLPEQAHSIELARVPMAGPKPGARE